MSEAGTAAKPLGIKAYGHIGHLPGSRMGPGDHHVHEGQARICTERPRDRRDRVIVQAKLDGSCVAVARIGEDVAPLIRSGHRACSSPHEQHRLFAQWAYANRYTFALLLHPGERLVGEWLAQAHGTRYDLPHGPFVAFDLMRGHRRATVAEMGERVGSLLPMPCVLHAGAPLSVASAQHLLQLPRHGELDPAEGAVWRLERDGEVDFLAKWVRPDKVDGAYLPEVSGQAPVWNWRPKGAGA